MAQQEPIYSSGCAGFEELVCDARRRAKPGVKPLELSREASRLNILLPLGSSEGEYDVRIENVHPVIIVVVEEGAGETFQFPAEPKVGKDHPRGRRKRRDKIQEKDDDEKLDDRRHSFAWLRHHVRRSMPPTRLERACHQLVGWAGAI